MTKPITTVLLDFDGTIMDTNDAIIRSWQEAFRVLRGEEGDIDVIKGTFGEPLELSMRNLFPEVPVEEAIRPYREYQRKNLMNEIHLVDGARELLDELMRLEYPMALVTSRLRETTERALDQFDLWKYMDCVVTANDVTRHKPDPQCVEIALEKLGAGPEETIMLGDTIHDIQCGKNAGVKVALVSWSLTLGDRTKEDFPEEDVPDHILDTPADLLKILKEE